MTAYFNNPRPINLNRRDAKPIPKPERQVKEKVYVLAKKSDKKKQQEKEDSGEKALQDLWFLERTKELKGTCANCGASTPKSKSNIAHLVPKSIFKSVKRHPKNWVELCAHGKDCHGNYDRRTRGYELHELNCRDLIIERFREVYPFIAEKSKLPDYLLQEIEIEDVLGTVET